MLWNPQIARDLCVASHGPMVIFEDNTGAEALAYNPRHQRRTKHIGVQYHFVRDHIKRGNIDVKFCGTKDMVGDIFTKNLPKPAFERFRAMLFGQRPQPAYMQHISSAA